jgi:acetyltransferase-like isoleucine patch superfamily enzyme
MGELDPGELAAGLHRLWATQDDALRRSYDRSLPFADGLFDRWERAARLGFAEGASVYDSAMIFGAVSVGANTWIGPGVLLDGSGGGISIGEWCSISAGVHIYTHDTVLRSLSSGLRPRSTGGVRIGDACHLGAQSVVVLGVSVGDRCVIGANSFVNRDVPDRAVVGGSPARPLGMVVGEGEDVRVWTGPEAVAALAERAR